MNPLELLKEKLRVKPIVEEVQKVSVAIPIANAPEKVEISKVTILDERGKQTGFSRKELIGKNISTVCPKLIAKVHDKFSSLILLQIDLISSSIFKTN